MKNLVRLATLWLLLGPAVMPAEAGFTSLYIFGDGVSSTTNGPGGSLFYGNRFCNGRVWVEVLAERQGLTVTSNRNWSYFGHSSPELAKNSEKFTAPPDANTSLFVIWVSDADFVFYISNYSPYTTNNIATWTNAMNQSLSNHVYAVSNFYAKGVRTLIMPPAVDITKTPGFSALPAASRTFIRQRTIDYNSLFAITLNQLRTNHPGLTIYSPDFFSLVDDLVAHPADYGLTNTVIGAVDDPALANKSLDGPGAYYYLFWDYLDPTAKIHMLVADLTQQLIAPARISKVISQNGSNTVEIANVPIGRHGFIDGTSDFANWTPDAPVTSTNLTQSVVLPMATDQRFYRLRFPFLWFWP